MEENMEKIKTLNYTDVAWNRCTLLEVERDTDNNFDMLMDRRGGIEEKMKAKASCH